MSYPYIAAKPISYGRERSYDSIKYIVIHYTGNNGDTAKNNCDFFHNGNTRSAGAHFFVSQDGSVCQSIQMKKAAYAVGGFVTQKNGAGSFYKQCTNMNSVSIELCDNASRDPSDAQTEAVRQLVQYIRRVCPNATRIIRHWDVSGKSCPARMIGVNQAKWLAFRTAISAAEAPAQKPAPAEKPKEEEEMKLTQEEFDRMFDIHMMELAELDPSDWGGKELQDAIEWAKSEGIIKGGQHGELMMQKPLTRQEMVLMLYRQSRK